MTSLILWGRKKGVLDLPWEQAWIKLSDNVSKAEMRRREKDGWEALRYPKGKSPNKLLEGIR